MSLEQKLIADLTGAMKRRDELETSVLRMLKSLLMLKKTEKDGPRELSDDTVREVFASYAKNLAESIEQFRLGNREESAVKHEAELAVVRRYLPEPAGEDEVRRVIEETVAETGAAGPRDMGRVMGPVMASLKGRADGSLVSRLVRERLQGS